uniref:Putative secreted protein n=1 Tax=Anopheles marajoara TaxID=58244 RepID=A0A2M4CDX9_9DIPT
MPSLTRVTMCATWSAMWSSTFTVGCAWNCSTGGIVCRAHRNESARKPTATGSSCTICCTNICSMVPAEKANWPRC